MKPNGLDIWWVELIVDNRVEASVWKLTTTLSVENLLNSWLHIALQVSWYLIYKRLYNNCSMNMTGIPNNQIWVDLFQT